MLATFNDWLVEITNVPVFTWPQLGPFQVLDILILAALLYLIIGWIRRTQAWVLIRGIALVLFVALLAQIFDLLTVQWILQNTLGMGLVVIVILFQPELRKALEQIGRGRYLGNLKVETEGSALNGASMDGIVNAVMVLSSQLTGALIVLEQNVDISEHTASGVNIDALISTQILVNIFEKNAPLHDGAIIIKNNRISHAACILPLSSQTLDSSLGTRHRAAVGISEASDARVVVVSEETGTVSVVSDGKIVRGVDAARLKDFLVRGIPTQAGLTKFFQRRKK